ncbi:MAG: type VII secretion-associated protein [Rhodococcus sp. (in: high G+C Gram-positive bacteria)]
MNDVVGLHFERASTWCCAAGVVSRIPSLVIEYDGVALHGDSVLEVPSSAAFDGEPVDVLGYVDDEYLPLAGGGSVQVVDAVSGLFADALHRAGVVGGSHDLVVMHPPHWGRLRSEVLSQGARPLARDVLLVSSAVVACDAAESRRPCGCDGGCRTVVLDLTPNRTTVSTVVRSAAAPEVVACTLVDSIFDDTDVDAVTSSVSEAIEQTRAAAPVCRVVVHGSSGAPVPSVDAAGGLSIVVLDEEEMSSAVVPSARIPMREPLVAPISPERPHRTRPWLAERTADTPPARRLDRVRLIGLVVAAAVVIGTGVGVTATRHESAPVGSMASGIASTVAPVPSTASATPTVSSVPAPVAREFRSAGMSLDVPAGWHVEPGNERVELLPDVRSDMRVVVVSRELAAGLGVGDVESVLRSRVDSAEPQGRLGGLAGRGDVAGFPALEYMENASDGTTVAWTVVVSPGGQTSVGCQSAAELSTAITSVCESVLSSLNIR